MNKYIKLFSNCIPVKGYKQSLIVDLQRANSSNTIPNSLYEIITKYSNDSVEDIKKAYNNEFDGIIDEYFEFLLDNEFAFKCQKKELSNFPKLNLEWKSPSIIENAIIDIDNFNSCNVDKFIKELSVLRCNALQIRFYSSTTKNIIEEIGELLEGTRILSAELILKNSEYLSQEVLEDIANKYPRFQRIYIYSAYEDSMSPCNRIYFNTKDIIPDKDCGNISHEFFSICVSTFTESQEHNTCLNRKISVDTKGRIKNCPSMQKSYGNISDTDLVDVIKNPEFTKFWNIKKDNIDVCKDCEYRHVCTDCRACVKDSNNILSQPSKCGYNPYIARWKDEDGYIDVDTWRLSK